MYKCKECDKQVIIVKGQEPIRTCKCNGLIICDVSSTASGVGGIKK